MSSAASKAFGLPLSFNPSNRQGDFSPLRLFVITISSIFIAEIAAMTVVYFIESLPYYVTTIVDAGIMVILIFPVLYLFSFRPLIQYIDRLEQADRALYQKEELQARFFNSMDVMIAYMDRDFNFIKVNDAYAYSSQGRTPDFFVGKNHFVLYPPAENRAIFQQVVETGIPYTVYEKQFEYLDQPERGTTYWNWSLQPVKDPEGEVEGVVLSLVDVTERKQAEQKAERERARLRSILDTMPDGVYIVNQQYEVEYTNPVIEREFGSVNGRKCFSYAHDRNDVCPWCKNPSVFEGEASHWEWEAGTGKIYEVHDMPITNADGSLSKLKIIHDITDRKQAESELERRNFELQKVSASEHRQRQVADTLRGAAQALTQSLDLDTVLHTLLKHVRAITQADTASVFFPEGENVMSARAVEGYEKWTDPNTLLSIKMDIETHPIFGKLLASRSTLLIPDTAQDPDWVAYPGTEPIHSRLYAPVVVEDKVIAIVGLGKQEPAYFTEEHIQWAEALVGQAGVAIQNAWLFEQVQTGRERLQVLSRRLVEIQEKERVYIARELHDQANQTLSSLILGLGMLEKEAEASAGIRSKAAELKGMTDQVLEELHRLAVNLRPASLDHAGLTAALQQLIRIFTQDTGMPIRLKTVGFREDERLVPEVEATLYRIVQEALTNVIRHAQASRADVMLERRDGSIVLIVEDDGKGFDPRIRRGTGHLGVLGMQERAEMLGGTLTIESKRGGTTLFAEVPYGDTDIDRR